MKTPLLMLSTSLLLASATYAQHVPAAQVPAAAKATFRARFPAVKAAQWAKEGAAYEAGFQLHGKAMSAVITPTGTWQETETDMLVGDLPAAVRTALARDYRSYKVAEAATITKADGTTVYEAELAKGGQKQDVLFAADGRVAPK